jgi:hypothetical protein
MSYRKPKSDPTPEPQLMVALDTFSNAQLGLSVIIRKGETYAADSRAVQAAPEHFLRAGLPDSAYREALEALNARKVARNAAWRAKQPGDTGRERRGWKAVAGAPAGALRGLLQDAER